MRLLLALALAGPAAAGVAEDLSRIESEHTAIRKRCAAMPDSWAKLPCLFEADQQVRSAWMNSPRYEPEDRHRFDRAMGELMKDVDTESLGFLKRMIERDGWPRVSVHGTEVAHGAWLLAQHADRDVAFQKKALGYLAELFPKGEAAEKDYAYLYDRVAVNEKRPQRYGTQGGCKDGAWAPSPIEEPEAVDERRARVGLGPMAEYRLRFRKMCR